MIKGRKLLAILGSPYPNGRCAGMLDCAVTAARKAGWQVDVVRLYEKNLAFCTGCRACMKSGCCVKKDDIEGIAALLNDCDAVVLSAPVYWANVPAAVKNMFDRLYGSVMEETKTFPKPRLSGNQRYLLLTACNTPFPFSRISGQSSGALRAMDEFFKTSGMKRLGCAAWTGPPGKELPGKGLPERLRRRITGYWS